MAERTVNRQKQAQESYKLKDVEKSKTTHDTCPCDAAEEKHKIAHGQFVKSIIYGGLDGIVSTFVIICSIEGADFNPVYALVLGFSNLIGDAISMGMGDYLSATADIEHQKTEYKREKWEFDVNPEGEIEEMIELLEERGVSHDDAEVIMRTTAKYPDIFMDQMMYYELGFMPLDENEKPAKQGVVTFFAFCLFGLVPLLSYVLFGLLPWETYDTINRVNLSFAISCIATAITLFVLGAVKANFSGEKWAVSGLKVAVMGALACAASYLIGFLIARYMLKEDAQTELCNV
ncbi:hypothetical protein ACHWQZ_G006124 [Mnemiopsis leidyi]